VGPPALDPFGFVGQRRRLIETIRASGIEDLEVLRLFDQVPRHLFLPAAMRAHAYEDAAIPIGHGQTASQPSLQAAYLESTRPGPTDAVLEIGTGSGYLTALLATAAGRVYSVERVRELSVRARKALDAIEIRNAALLVGDGSIGWRKFAPYDIIVVSAASPAVPPALLEQLAEGGRMLIPIGTLESQRLVLLRRSGEATSEESVRDRCSFVPLLGRQGWAEEGA
jgi:protein-L-isoaspartate(D-aspartate) O-methyltransferase